MGHLHGRLVFLHRGVLQLLLADAARLRSMREAMLDLARPDAAEDVADELVALAEARRR